MLKIKAKCSVCNENLVVAVHNVTTEIAEEISLSNTHDTIAYISVKPCLNCENRHWNAGYWTGKKSQQEP